MGESLSPETSKFTPRWSRLGGLSCLGGLGLVFTAAVLSPGSFSDPGFAPMEHAWSLPLLLVGIAMIGAGAYLIRFNDRPIRAKPSGMTREMLAPVIETTELPFSVCTGCRVVIDDAHALSCPQCESRETCLRIEDDSERAMAIAAIPVTP